MNNLQIFIGLKLFLYCLHLQVYGVKIQIVQMQV